jgi:hypothetical protein
MPYDIAHLLINNDEKAMEFRRLIRSYNNSFAFTTFAAKHDSKLIKNTKAVYTFKIQGQVYHFLEDLVCQTKRPIGIQLYFYDIKIELNKRIKTSPQFNP